MTTPEIEDAIKEVVPKDSIHIANKRAMCSNCWHTWNTESKKESRITCSQCGSRTSNIFYRTRTEMAREFQKVEYELVMCPRCQYIWLLHTKNKYAQCPSCRRDGDYFKRRIGVFKVAFNRKINAEPEVVREMLKFRFPKAKDKIDRLVDGVIEKWRRVNPK